ncbi:MAG: HPr(Ser) kinase/phosphatase [Ruminococcaceae bacterium]|nr:HPr(Ser) kinase/phosphatase [Oscillospiraceae bacterium]
MQSKEYTIKLSEVVQKHNLKSVYVPDNYEEILVSRPDLSRPGLPFAGYFTDFENERIQLIGNMEHSYLASLSCESRRESLKEFFAHNVKAVVVTTDLSIFDELLEEAKNSKTPLFSSSSTTSALMAAITSSLNVSLAERITQHGVLVEVYGEGILILGDSGVGKSETAIELVKRGHRLIADDMVEIKKVSAITLVGAAPELIRHYIELRGIGIVDVKRIFGMGSVKDSEKIDLIINFENWVQGKMYDRFGLDTEYTEILGINIPSITIPVKPGRNLAVIIEIAAMNHRQKKMGFNTAEEFEKRLKEQAGIID